MMDSTTTTTTILRMPEAIAKDYSTLPELLGDLAKLTNLEEDNVSSSGGGGGGNNNSSWSALLDCGGDSYQMVFSNDCGLRLDMEPRMVGSTYENMDILQTELNFLRDTVAKVQHDELRWKIMANGGKPFLRVYIQRFPRLNPEQEVPHETVIQSNLNRWGNLCADGFFSGAGIMILMVPTYIALKYLGNH